MPVSTPSRKFGAKVYLAHETDFARRGGEAVGRSAFVHVEERLGSGVRSRQEDAICRVAPHEACDDIAAGSLWARARLHW